MKTKRLVSILLALMLVVGIVPTTVFAAPPGGGGGGNVIDPSPASVFGFNVKPTAKTDLVADGTPQELINAGTTDYGTAYYYATTEDLSGAEANDLFSYPSKPGSFSTSIPTATDAGTYYVWYATDGGGLYEDALPCMTINEGEPGEYEDYQKLTVIISAPVTHTHDSITFEPWTSTNSLPQSGSYYLTADVTVTSRTTVSGTLNLCLNGHGIKFQSSGNSIISVQNESVFNLYDCGNTEHRFTVTNTAPNGAGYASVSDSLGSGFKTFTGGYITGGHCEHGGAVYVDGGVFNMYGGNIIGNTASGYKAGAAIFVNNGTFAMHGGKIMYNYAQGMAGGVYIDADASEKTGRFIMTGGEIAYNEAYGQNASFYGGAGGGVCSRNNASGSYIVYDLTGGSIHHNAGLEFGAGINFTPNNGTLNIGGNISITDNYGNEGGVRLAFNTNDTNFSGSPVIDRNMDKNNDEINLFLVNDTNVKVVGEMTNTTPIGVTMKTIGVLTSSSDTDLNDVSKFVSEKPDTLLLKNNDGQLQVVSLHTVTWKNWDGTTLETDTNVPATTMPSYDGATPTKAEDAQFTYTFAGWTPEVVAVTGDAEYTATFIQNYMLAVKKLTGETYTVYANGDTTVAQLKELVAAETGIPAAAQRLIFAGKQLANDKTLTEYNIKKESTIHLAPITRTVTWKNEDGTTIGTTNVLYGSIPAYEAPTKASDSEYNYVFAGWTPEIAAVTEDAEYTATFNAVERSLFTGHSISLNGDVDVNFYLDLTEDQIDDGVVVNYEWAKGTASYTVSASDFVSGRGFKTLAKLPAAEMSYAVTATVVIGGVEQAETNTYSVRDYALATIADPNSSEELVTLMKTMLNYGAKAQDVFDRTDVVYANAGVDYTQGTVTAAMIDNAINTANGVQTASNLNDVAAEIGAKYYTSSIVFLYECTLRHYFTPNGSALDASLFDGVKSNYYYYVEKTDIPAAQLDTLQTFNVGEVTFRWSALDFVKAILEKYPEDSAQYALAAATYWYNDAANVFFGA